MLPRRLYEGLPYLYLGVGVLLLIAPVNFSVLSLVGVLLYGAGAVIWIQRSSYRRQDLKQSVIRRRKRIPHPSPRRRHWTQPAWLYELLPFAYIATGLLAFSIASSILLYVSASLLLGAGVIALCLRARNRQAEGV